MHVSVSRLVIKVKPIFEAVRDSESDSLDLRPARQTQELNSSSDRSEGSLVSYHSFNEQLTFIEKKTHAAGFTGVVSKCPGTSSDGGQMATGNCVTRTEVVHSLNVALLVWRFRNQINRSLVRPRHCSVVLCPSKRYFMGEGHIAEDSRWSSTGPAQKLCFCVYPNGLYTSSRQPLMIEMKSRLSNPNRICDGLKS